MSKNPNDFLVKPDLTKPSTWKFRIFENGKINLEKLDFVYALLSDSRVLRRFGLVYRDKDKTDILAQLNEIYLSLGRNKPDDTEIFKIAKKWELIEGTIES